MRRKILISAGEASGDLYASLVTAELRKRWPDADFFGCTGPRLRAEGVRTVVDAASLAVVGLLEVVAHIPRIYGEYRKLIRAARDERPELAILTDSPDFHLRAARRLHRMGIPVAYLVAPQVWAWRRGRIAQMRRTLEHVLCIFPFEEAFFRGNGVRATYIGHPLAGLVRPALERGAFFRKHDLDSSRPLIAVLPGSRRGEAARHLPELVDAVRRLDRERPFNWVMPVTAGAGAGYFRERMAGGPVRVIEGESWDAMAHAELALAASGTVTVEAALLGTPMVTYYKVTGPSWIAGKFLVDTPYYCMVNLIAGRKVVPELMQSEMNGANLAAAARELLQDGAAREKMKAGLAEVRDRLAGGEAAPKRAAAIVEEIVEGRTAHVS